MKVLWKAWLRVRIKELTLRGRCRPRAAGQQRRWKPAVTRMQGIPCWMLLPSELQRDTAGLTHGPLQKTRRHARRKHTSEPSAEGRVGGEGDVSTPFTSISRVPLWHFIEVQKWRDSWARMSPHPRETEEVVEGL